MARIFNLGINMGKLIDATDRFIELRQIYKYNKINEIAPDKLINELNTLIERRQVTLSDCCAAIFGADLLDKEKK